MIITILLWIYNRLNCTIIQPTMKLYGCVLNDIYHNRMRLVTLRIFFLLIFGMFRSRVVLFLRFMIFMDTLIGYETFNIQESYALHDFCNSMENSSCVRDNYLLLTQKSCKLYDY